VFFWHLFLLEQKTKEVPGVRPAVISTETGTRRDEYRRFRSEGICCTQVDAGVIDAKAGVGSCEPDLPSYLARRERQSFGGAVALLGEVAGRRAIFAFSPEQQLSPTSQQK